MAPKKKGQRMALGEFISEFGDAADSTSWADDEMPSVAAVPQDPWSGANSGYGGGNAGWGARPRTMMREAAPVPNSPPYTARLISLPYDINETTIREFFVDQGLAVSSVRLPKDAEAGRIRGYGFVEFDDRESLVQALSCEGKMLGSRALRIAVAEQRMGERDRTDDDWRSGRRGPLPPLERDDRGFGGRRRGGFDEPEFDWSVRREPREREPREPREPRGDRGFGDRGGFGERGGFGGRGPRPPRDEPELDWSARREPAFSRPPRQNRHPRPAEPEFDWSVRKTLPELPNKTRQDRHERGERPERSERNSRARNFDEWGRAAPSAATAVGSTPSTAPASTKDITKGFAVLSTDDEPAEEQAAAPVSRPAAQNDEAAPVEQPTDGSWSLSSSGRH